MKCNVGTVDRATRAMVGIIVGAWGLMLETRLFRWPMILVGVTLIFTAIFAWCPMYYATGWSTHSKTI